MGKVFTGPKYSTGTVFQAKYSDPLIGDYRGNPLIEALPAIMSKKEVSDIFSKEPPYDHEERKLPPELRSHCVNKLFSYFYPLDVHFQLEQQISMLLRQGYVTRNPLINFNVTDIAEDSTGTTFYTDPACPRSISDAIGFTITGKPGVGISKGLEKVLSTYPQMLIHDDYNSIDFYVYQIVWLKIEFPSTGTLRGLCKSFFRTMDKVIWTTNYEYTYCSSGTKEDRMLKKMKELAAFYCVGVLIIDFQNLSFVKGKTKKILDLLNLLINELGVPLIFVGIDNSLEFLQTYFLEIRKNQEQSDIEWPKLSKDETWEHFLTKIWKYQWTDEECPLTEELNDTLFAKSQGSVDLAIRLYARAQLEIIAAGKGKITSNLINKIAEHS